MITSQSFQIDRDTGLMPRDLAELLAPDTIANILTMACTDKKCKKEHLYVGIKYRVGYSPRRRYKKRATKK